MRIEHRNVKSILNDSTIKWTKENELGFKGIDIPIIIAPLRIGTYECAVIDGNHRLSFAIRNNIKTLPTIFVGAKNLIDNSFFACGFDKLLYTMILEMPAASVEKRKGAADEAIAIKSYLSDGVFKYWV